MTRLARLFLLTVFVFLVSAGGRAAHAQRPYGPYHRRYHPYRRYHRGPYGPRRGRFCYYHPRACHRY